MLDLHTPGTLLHLFATGLGLWLAPMVGDSRLWAFAGWFYIGSFPLRFLSNVI